MCGIVTILPVVDYFLHGLLGKTKTCIGTVFSVKEKANVKQKTKLFLNKCRLYICFFKVHYKKISHCMQAYIMFLRDRSFCGGGIHGSPKRTRFNSKWAFPLRPLLLWTWPPPDRVHTDSRLLSTATLLIPYGLLQKSQIELNKPMSKGAHYFLGYCNDIWLD